MVWKNKTFVLNFILNCEKGQEKNRHELFKQASGEVAMSKTQVINSPRLSTLTEYDLMGVWKGSNSRWDERCMNPGENYFERSGDN